MYLKVVILPRLSSFGPCIGTAYGISYRALQEMLAERGALLYSLIETCKLNGVDPDRYLRHVLDAIADWPVNRVSALLPWRITLPVE